MREWINFKEKKPSELTVALVFNERGFLNNVKAIYHPRYDVWALFDPNYRESIVLDVTHYLPIPEHPPLK